MAELTARRWRSALGVLASSALLAAAIAWAEPGPMFDALRRTTPGWLAAAAGLSLASNVVQSAELVRQALVLHGATIRYRTALEATVANLALQNLLPAGLGQVSRAWWLHRAAGVEPTVAARVAATVLGAKVAVLGLLAAVGLGWGAAAALLALLGLTAAGLARGARACAVAAHAGLATGAEVGLLLLCLAAVGAPLSGPPALAAAAAVLVAARLPGATGGFGSRELAAVAVFGPTVGPGAAAAGAVLFGAVERLLPLVLGSLVFPVFLRGLEGGSGSVRGFAEGNALGLDGSAPVAGDGRDRVRQ